MKVLVCTKQIPDPAAPYHLDPETHFLERPTDQILDDTDRYGVEMGLQVAEQTEGSVTLVSMGPAGNLQGIRQALAMGADKAIVIEDDSLRGADSWVTAQVLAAAIRNEGFDLVIAGTESTDGSSGVLPQQLSELLGVPSLTFAKHLERDGDTIRIQRQTEYGYEVVEAPTPVLITVTSGVVEPRYPTFKGIMAAKKKPIEQIGVSELGVTPVATQEILEVRPAPKRAAGEIIEDEGEAHLRIIEVLEQAKVI
ncbi:electron transfer flavoprotein subunit beta [bacterium BMS3Abin02]|nr:electron transfer flavoprotein subunit beta [bacterium BMS3Abin02]GBE22454.1 electron transfer flavoprotein subunit beta [bacterium BMS3Bbin01]HDH25239.1 electron transfer flavoprotein beta subunit/FixA family protein [Actinomycetota bacterium]